MKVTHRLKMTAWYEPKAIKYGLTEPHISVFIHYIIGFLFRALNSHDFYETRLYSYREMNIQIRFSFNFAIFLANLLFYYPTIIFLVEKTLNNIRLSYRIIISILILNIPTYVITEYTYGFFNVFSITLLLWSLYFFINGYLILGTIVITLCSFTKYSLAPYGILFLIFAFAHCWNYSTKYRLLYFLFKFTLMTISALITLGISLLPFYNIKSTILIILKGFINFYDKSNTLNNPSIWKLLYQMYHFDIDKYDISPQLILIVSLFIICITMLPFLIKKYNNRRIFLCCFTTFSLASAIFGYIHSMEAITYSIISILLLPDIYKDFIIYIIAIASWICCSSNVALLQTYISCIPAIPTLSLGWIIEHRCMSISEKKSETKNIESSFVQSEFLKKIKEKLQNESQSILYVLIGVIIAVCGTYLDCKLLYECEIEHLVMFNDLTLCFSFLGLLFFWGYSWVILLSLSLY